MRRTWACGVIVLCVVATVVRGEEPGKQESAEGIRHSFLALGAETYIVDEDGKVTWKYPKGTRDGWVLPSGNVLLAVNKDREFPGGAAVEVTREGKVVFQFKG